MDIKKLSIILSLVLIFSISYYVLSIFLVGNEETFFTMSVLGETGLISNYYPNGNSTIGKNVLVRWNIRIYNHMNVDQYVSVKVKILDSMLPSPNSSLCLPSPVPAFFEISHSLDKNETWIYPLFWQISEIEYREDGVVLNELVINDVVIPLNSTLLRGNKFRMVFELWVFDEVLDDFSFVWRSRQKDCCVWNQIWFNM